MLRAKVRGFIELRRKLADAERALREQAGREAISLVCAERAAWRAARDACHAFDRVRPKAIARLKALNGGAPERFPGERRLAEMALHDASRADAVYTILSFARLQDRLRYLRGGFEREGVIRESIERGGIYTAACRGRHFQGIVK
jgi:hypothetical protein